MRELVAVPMHADPDTLLKRLHVEPDSEFAPELIALAHAAESAARPRALFEKIAIDRKLPDGIVARGVRFTSTAMAFNLKEADAIIPYVATCGPELDAMPVDSQDGFGRFAVEILKEMALHQVMKALQERVGALYGPDASTTTMNPGSGDRTLWPIEEQKPLFALLGDVEGAVGVRLTGSCLMIPNKSVSGFYFRTADGRFHNCKLCKRRDCPNRREEFDAALWEAAMREQTPPPHHVPPPMAGH